MVSCCVIVYLTKTEENLEAVCEKLKLGLQVRV